jgi:4-amino-4-deoxychorismate lyase
MLTLINGEPQTHLPVTDRGLHYGDGLFETVAVRHGRVCLWDRHMQRLGHGCERLALPAPDTDGLHAAVTRAVAGSEQAVAKIIVTRGSGTRGYRPAATGTATWIVQGLPWPSLPTVSTGAGIAVRWCQMRLSKQPRLAGLKHLNRLEQVLARAEWSDDYAEGLMCDSDGDVVEGTQSNLFLVRNGTLITPDLTQSGVAGVMRATVLDLARSQGIPCSVQVVSVAMVDRADELFLTNSLIGIEPIARVGATNYEVAGTVTQTLQAALQRAIDVVA